MKIVELKNKICCSNKIYIYGAGEYGKVVAAYLLDIGMLEKLDSFIVTNLGETDKLFGKDIKNWENIYSRLDGSELIIVSVSEKKQEEIAKRLSESGIFNYLCISDTNYICLNNSLNYVSEISLYAHEILYGMNFDRAISESSWLKRKDFAPGGMAVCSQYLYILYKILDSQKFKNLLDVGMGQTSKMMCQYADSNLEVNHTIIEADKEWIDFFTASQSMDYSKVELMEYETRKVNGSEVRCFSEFEQRLQDQKFDYISIDAPLGSELYSRVDILEILPQCLADSWIIMMDDVGRIGERNTLEKIRNVLEEHKIKYVEQQYSGADKSFVVLASYDNRFFTSV